MPNVFVTEANELVFINEFAIPKSIMDQIDACFTICNNMEKKYETNDAVLMIKRGSTRMELIQYIDAKRELMSWGYA